MYKRSLKHASVVPQPTTTTTSVPVGADDDEPPSPHSSARTSQVEHSNVDGGPVGNDAGQVGSVLSFGRERKKETTDPEKQEEVRPATEQALVSGERAVLRKTGRLRTLFTPRHPVGPSPTYRASAKATLKYTPLNIFLLCVPTSWILHYTHQSPVVIFVFAGLGILPLAALLGLGTEQIALRTSQSIGGLLNATLGNVIELIVAAIALSHCDLNLVQSSLLGGLLSNLLLVLGMAFAAGGFRFHQQEFQPIVAQLNLTLMTLSVITLLVPAAFHEFLSERLQMGEEGQILLQLSRGTSVILLLIYIAYLFFQFYSHSHLFVDTVQQPTSRRSSASSSSVGTGSIVDPVLPPPVTSSLDHIEKPRLNVPFALGLLVAITALAYLTAEFLVDALDEVAASAPFSKEFLTLIIIPIISNAAEHTTAVVVASKGKFDLALGVAVGSCIQIALFVIPVLVLVAWCVGKPLSLVFDPLETLCLFFSVLLVKFSVEDGKAHWMSGVVLVAVYIVIALSFWNFPDNLGNDIGLVCA
ncbi:calcium/proton exchanger [Fomitiporia mediterranea MF3/22]|uniref:calcium/proton exchanger n=1 Tax=Fomitiporia mediterranea (strain MF3/22) TaxID=694068 RepID=UPI0004407B25|nr:calcium/proton exchanger [Fomitiporia mediterranea MF3/22]EJD07523.1 calcium/proton exchanger [Fomitiporia mediterranea MF3/22]